MDDTKIPVGISSCLLGEKVRFDGGHKQHSYIISTLGQYFDFRTFCPEVSIGLGIPREPIRLVTRDDQIRCVGTRNASMDVTDELIDCGQSQKSWQSDIYAYIVKKDSPSCGMERVKVYNEVMATRTGTGLYTKVLMDNFPNLPVEEEGRLGDAVLRENFIQRIFIYKRWRDLLDNGLSLKLLTRFHAQHKLILFSHNQERARALGRQLSECKKNELDDFKEEYISEFMQIVKIPASKKNHVNVLQHIQGYLKKKLDSEDKAELSQVIEEYRHGQVPLIVPITLLRHHFRKTPDAYIDESWYMKPHPKELALLNSL